MSMEGFLLKYPLFRSKKKHLQLIVKEDCALDIDTLSRYFENCVKLFDERDSFYALSPPGTCWQKIGKRSKRWDKWISKK